MGCWFKLMIFISNQVANGPPPSSLLLIGSGKINDVKPFTTYRKLPGLLISLFDWHRTSSTALGGEHAHLDYEPFHFNSQRVEEDSKHMFPKREKRHPPWKGFTDVHAEPHHNPFITKTMGKHQTMPRQTSFPWIMSTYTRSYTCIGSNSRLHSSENPIVPLQLHITIKHSWFFPPLLVVTFLLIIVCHFSFYLVQIFVLIIVHCFIKPWTCWSARRSGLVAFACI